MQQNLSEEGDKENEVLFEHHSSMTHYAHTMPLAPWKMLDV